MRTTDSAIVPDSAIPLAFGDQTAIMMAPGSIWVSDPVDLAAPAFSDLAIDLFLPGDTSLGTTSVHASALERNFLSPPGNVSGADVIEGATPVTSWFLLSRVRDAKQPTRFLPEYDSGDHLHPGDAGYEAMGNGIDLKVFGR